MKEATENVDYDLPKLTKSKWSTYLAGMFFISFLLYFPISSQVESLMRKAMGSAPGCPISYQDIGFELFMPKVVVSKLSLPASCFGKPGAPIVMDNLYLYIRGINFAPFGPHFKVQTEFLKNPIEAFITLGFGTVAVNMDKTKIALPTISEFLPAGIKLAGDLNVDTLVKAQQRGIDELNLKVTSKNFALPAQNIMGFALSRLNIDNLLLMAKMGDDNVLKVSELIIGDADSPIRGNMRGTIRVNQRSPEASQLNLVGEVAFSQEFIDKYSIIGMVMNQFDKKDDFYQIQLGGTLAMPIPSSRKK